MSDEQDPHALAAIMLAVTSAGGVLGVWRTIATNRSARTCCATSATGSTAT